MSVGHRIAPIFTFQINRNKVWQMIFWQMIFLDLRSDRADKNGNNRIARATDGGSLHD
jgi:hypothetical protein